MKPLLKSRKNRSEFSPFLTSLVCALITLAFGLALTMPAQAAGPIGDEPKIELRVDEPLLLPVPSTLATFSEVNVDGVNGMALTSIDGQGNVLIWQKSGVLFLVVGNQTVSDLVALANEMP